MKKPTNYVVLALFLAALACDTTGSPTESPKIHTATPEILAPTATNEPAGSEVTATPGGKATEPAPTASATLAPTHEPTATAVQESFLGDVVEHDGYAFSAAVLEDPATPGVLYQKLEGKRLVAVRVIVGNVSADPFSASPLDITLLDSEGFTYQADLGSRDGQMPLVTLGRGERVAGWISYQIPDGAEAARVRYSVSTFSDIELETGLNEAPAGHTILIGTPRETPKLSKLGDAVEQGGYSITPVTLEDPANASQFYTPQAGTRLVAVELILANVSGAKISSNPLDFFMVDTLGFVYQSELAGHDGQLDLVDLNPGNKVKGWVAFAIQADATPESIKYVPSIFSDLGIVAGLAQ